MKENGCLAVAGGGWGESLVSKDRILKATTRSRQTPAELPQKNLFPLDHGFWGFLSLFISSSVYQLEG